MKQKILAIILLTVLSVSAAFTQSLNKPKLDSLFNILAEKNKAMGCLTISKKGTVIYSKAIGYSFVSDKEKIPATEQTRYRIGSITKMFTATIILQLVEEGKLSLITTVDKFYPVLPNANKITINNLLNHRSGLHNFTDDSTYTTWMTHPKTHDEMLAIIAKGGVDFQPDEKFSYSNSNYIVLGYIIEKICNKAYKEVLNERILSKVGLANIYYGDKTNVKNNECYSYLFKSKWEQQPETDMSIPGGAGAIVSTTADLARFIEALFSLQLVSQKSLNLMKTMTDGYGLGMYQIPFFKKIAYGHNGGIDGFESALAYFPEDSLSIAYCSNGVMYPMNNVLIGILSIYFNRDYTLSTFIKSEFTLKKEDMDKYLGVYSSTQLHLKITITKDNKTLIAQATGQSSFPLEPSGKDKFQYEQAGIEMEFNTDKNEMILLQAGGRFLFTKEK